MDADAKATDVERLEAAAKDAEVKKSAADAKTDEAAKTQAAQAANAAQAQLRTAEDAAATANSNMKAKAEDATSNSLYRVYSREPANQAGTDLAKQLLVLIGTLVTAVASFYFGSKAVADAQAAAAGVSAPPTRRA